MKRNILIIIGVLILVLAGGFFVMQSARRGSDEVMMKDEGMEKAESASDDAMMSDDSAMDGAEKKVDSRYVEFSPEVLANATEGRRVLFFYASWCPTCKPADKNFLENEDKIPADVTVVRVNYNDPETDDEEKELAKKYGITYQHTFVQIDEEGMEVAKWNGGQIDELLENIK